MIRTRPGPESLCFIPDWSYAESMRKAHSHSLSVLVVNEEPSILGFLSSLLESNGIRALLARSAGEAMEIAQRRYIPIDLILTDVAVKESPGDSAVSEITGAELMNRLRHIRPNARALYMSAYVDASVIRIQPVSRQTENNGTIAAGNLIESIRTAATLPLALGGGCSLSQ